MRLPFNGRNKITSIYGYRLINGKREFHKGWDIVGLDDITIYAPCDGIIGSQTIITNKNNRTWTWGNYVRLDCENGDRVFMCHMSKRLVKRGDYVKEGQPIGIMGSTGYSFGAHVHMEFRKSPYTSNYHFCPNKRLSNIPNAKGVYMTDNTPKTENAQSKIEPIVGIDVSRYQGKINWDSVKNSGIKFAIIRAGYGRYINQKDPYFETNYNEAKRVGMPIGVYWYSYAKTSSEAVQEADVMLEVIKGKKFEYPVYFDQEDKSLSNVDYQTKTKIAYSFCKHLEEKKYFSGYYTFTSFANGVDYKYLAKYFTCWLADYRHNYNKTLPRDIHQYTSNGKVNGISGRVDMNRCTRDFPYIIKNAKLNGYNDSDTIEPPCNPPIISDKPHMVALKDKRLKVVKSNCEYFDTYSVDKPKGFLPQGSMYVCTSKSVDLANGFYWCTITYQGKEKWVALVEDNRAIIVDAPVDEKFEKCDKVHLNGKIYANSTTSIGKVKSQDYWIYDGVEINGRYRVTNAKFRCGAKPVGANVSGYVNKKDIKKL